MKAYRAALLVNCYCKVTWPDDGIQMASAAIDIIVPLVDASYMSHKHFDSDAANEALGLPKGAGAYGAFRFDDDSMLYVTCVGPLAVSGEGKPIAWIE